MPYHQAVLLKPSVDGLDIKPDGAYLDLTFGGGGHSAEILKRLGPEGRLLAFDQDEEAEANRPKDGRLIFVRNNFRFFNKYMKLHGIALADGILADLGVSSHHFDSAVRGFSFRTDGPLDMRMDRNIPKTAADILNTNDEAGLVRLFSAYGEIRNARTLARAVVKTRTERVLQRTVQLREVAIKCATRGAENKYLARVFQALRIAVNGELEVLRETLGKCAGAIKENGRLVVITYHSLEDRLVKNYMAKGNLEGRAEKDFYGNLIRPFEPLTRKPIMPDSKETEQNSRARSARLRISKRTGIKISEKEKET
jgi:16S rRNA (cytosine1402-N4)-methyltransferase